MHFLVRFLCCVLVFVRWALLYTLPGQAKRDVRGDALQQALAASYDFFYK
jgi:hypothetical protein